MKNGIDEKPFITKDEYASVTTITDNIEELAIKKFWQNIEQRLIKRDCLYFAGGTLCVDNDGKQGGIGLNLDGCGFVYSSYFHMKNSKVYVPKHILKLVHEIYIETKGSQLYKIHNNKS